MLGALENLGGVGAVGLSAAFAISKTGDYVWGSRKEQIFGRELKLYPEHEHRCKSKCHNGEIAKDLAILHSKEDFSCVSQISNLRRASNLNPPNNNE